MDSGGGGARIRLGVDVGGTFTDLVALRTTGAGTEIVVAKVRSVPADQSRGVLDAVDRAGLDPAEVERFAHGTTVATNALLERRGARTALVTTEGFRDVLEIGRQNRPALYDLTRDRPPALVPRDLRFVVRERCGPGGVLTPLDEDSVREVAGRLRDVESVAVCLLFGYLHPDHERRVTAILRAELPGVRVVASHEVLAQFREYERTSTTVADAYLTPRVSAYLHALAAGTTDRGLTAPLVMQSSGGVADLGAAADHAAACVLSGPAGGVVGAAYVAGCSGFADLLTFDMGGTSTDVAVVRDGQAATTAESVVAGVPIALPMVDIHTVSAGGGSVAWVDGGGALRVGPHSAGADPGPACYDRGGTAPTVTDADLLLGHLADGTTFGADVTLSRRAAERALATLGERLGMDAHATAAGIVAVADAEMVRALRVISVERGLDPRDLALVAFGGAGGLHACALADELGVRRVLVPLAAGVLSALGLAVGDVRQDRLAPLRVRLDADAAGPLRDAFHQLGRGANGVLTRFADCRYAGQSHELTVPVDAPDPAAIARTFAAEHERRYGWRAGDRPVEVVAARVVATVPGERPPLTGPPADPAAERSRRGGFEVVPRAGLGAGDRVGGPAVVEFGEATCLLPAGWVGRVDDTGTLVLERS